MRKKPNHYTNFWIDVFSGYCEGYRIVKVGCEYFADIGHWKEGDKAEYALEAIRFD